MNQGTLLCSMQSHSSNEDTRKKLKTRIESLESIVESLSQQDVCVDTSSSSIQWNTAGNETDDSHAGSSSLLVAINGSVEAPSPSDELGKLAVKNGQSRYICGNSWASLSDEVGELGSVGRKPHRGLCRQRAECLFERWRLCKRNG